MNKCGFLPVDDRFILKQMPRLEVQSFLDFAPHYFNYITNAVQQKVEILNLVCSYSALGFTKLSLWKDKSRACLESFILL